MKQAKLIFTILIVMLICCSISIGQAPTSGVRASYYPIGQVSSSGVVSVGAMKVDPIYISHMNFICDIMASCGLYPAGPDDIKTGESIYPVRQVSSDEIVSLSNTKTNAIDISQLKFICDVMASCLMA